MTTNDEPQGSDETPPSRVIARDVLWVPACDFPLRSHFDDGEVVAYRLDPIMPWILGLGPFEVVATDACRLMRPLVFGEEPTAKCWGVDKTSGQWVSFEGWPYVDVSAWFAPVRHAPGSFPAFDFPARRLLDRAELPKDEFAHRASLQGVEAPTKLYRVPAPPRSGTTEDMLRDGKCATRPELNFAIDKGEPCAFCGLPSTGGAVSPDDAEARGECGGDGACADRALAIRAERDELRKKLTEAENWTEGVLGKALARMADMEDREHGLVREIDEARSILLGALSTAPSSDHWLDAWARAVRAVYDVAALSALGLEDSPAYAAAEATRQACSTRLDVYEQIRLGLLHDVLARLAGSCVGTTGTNPCGARGLARGRCPKCAGIVVMGVPGPTAIGLGVTRW